MTDEKDMMLLGIISCVTDNSDTTHRSKKAKEDIHERQRQRSYYMKNGKKVCRDTFMFMYRLVYSKLPYQLTSGLRQVLISVGCKLVMGVCNKPLCCVVVNQFHLFMLTSIHPSVLHFPHPSPLHSFNLNSKLTFLVNLFRHRSLTIDTSDWLPQLMGPFSVFNVFVGVISCFWCGRQN